jgi:hypothetical protein
MARTLSDFRFLQQPVVQVWSKRKVVCRLRKEQHFPGKAEVGEKKRRGEPSGSSQNVMRARVQTSWKRREFVVDDLDEERR